MEREGECLMQKKLLKSERNSRRIFADNVQEIANIIKEEMKFSYPIIVDEFVDIGRGSLRQYATFGGKQEIDNNTELQYYVSLCDLWTGITYASIVGNIVSSEEAEKKTMKIANEFAKVTDKIVKRLEKQYKRTSEFSVSWNNTIIIVGKEKNFDKNVVKTIDDVYGDNEEVDIDWSDIVNKIDRLVPQDCRIVDDFRKSSIMLMGSGNKDYLNFLTNGGAMIFPIPIKLSIKSHNEIIGYRTRLDGSRETLYDDFEKPQINYQIKAKDLRNNYGININDGYKPYSHSLWSISPGMLLPIIEQYRYINDIDLTMDGNPYQREFKLYDCDYENCTKFEKLTYYVEIDTNSSEIISNAGGVGLLAQKGNGRYLAINQYNLGSIPIPIILALIQHPINTISRCVFASDNRENVAKSINIFGSEQVFDSLVDAIILGLYLVSLRDNDKATLADIIRLQSRYPGLYMKFKSNSELRNNFVKNIGSLTAAQIISNIMSLINNLSSEDIPEISKLKDTLSIFIDFRNGSIEAYSEGVSFFDPWIRSLFLDETFAQPVIDKLKENEITNARIIMKGLLDFIEESTSLQRDKITSSTPTYVPVISKISEIIQLLYKEGIAIEDVYTSLKIAIQECNNDDEKDNQMKEYLTEVLNTVSASTRLSDELKNLLNRKLSTFLKRFSRLIEKIDIPDLEEFKYYKYHIFYPILYEYADLSELDGDIEEAANCFEQVALDTETTNIEMKQKATIRFTKLSGQITTQIALDAALQAQSQQVAATTEPTIQCPSCENIVPSKNKFCPECGKPLQKQCSECGANNPISTKFCSECGNKFEN